MILGNGGSGEKLDGSETYSDRIGLFFFFTACAGVSIVVWVFNWICWVNQCCCCDFLHNPVNKRIAWWMSFSFLLGILACCISGFISGNRFGYAIEGTWCALDRIYYDIIEGPIVKSDQKWKGLTDEKTIKIDKIADEEPPSYTIKKTDTEKIKTEFIDKIDNLLYGLKVCRVFTMIYFSLFLIAVTFAGISMMFYACLKRQGYLIIFMHVLWNVIRFFIFSFFLFGTAYGIFFLMLRDARGVVRIIFESGENTAILGDSNTNLASFFKDFSNEDIIKKKCYIQEGEGANIKNSYFDCTFVRTNLHLAYRALNDASIESRKLCAVSLSSAFFGAVAVYFFLLVLHHYNNDLFFDSGKSIFKGFTGVGGGYSKKNREKDPAYKKRKLRAEIELTSKNDENSNYNAVNKNENDDD